MKMKKWAYLIVGLVTTTILTAGCSSKDVPVENSSAIEKPQDSTDDSGEKSDKQEGKKRRTVEIVQSNSSAPIADDGYCFIDAENGDKIAQIPVPESISSIDISLGGNQLDLSSDEDKFIKYRLSEYVKGPDDFFLFDTNSEYGDWYSKDYFDADVYNIEESDIQTEQIEGKDAHWKTTNYIQYEKDCIDVDGIIEIDGNCVSFHSRGYTEEELLDSLRGIKEEFFTCPNVRENSVFLENHEGTEFAQFPIPDAVYEFSIDAGGSSVSWHDDHGFFDLGCSYSDSIEEEMERIEEDIEGLTENASDSIEWKSYEGTNLEFMYTKYDYLNTAGGEEYQVYLVDAMANCNGNIVTINVNYFPDKISNIDEALFGLFDTIKPTQKNAGETDQKTEEEVLTGPAPDPYEGYCYIDNDEGEKIAQIEIPDYVDEAKIESFGRKIILGQDEYHYMKFEYDDDDESSRSYLQKYVESGEFFEYSDIDVEDTNLVNEQINGIDVEWREYDSTIDGFIVIDGNIVTISSEGLGEDKVRATIQSIKKESVPSHNIRSNTVYIENDAGQEIFMIPVSKMDNNPDIEIDLGGGRASFKYDIGDSFISIDASTSFYLSVNEAKESYREYYGEIDWNTYEGKELQYEKADYTTEDSDYTYTVALTEIGGSVVEIEVLFEPDQKGESEKLLNMLLDSIEPVQK